MNGASLVKAYELEIQSARDRLRMWENDPAHAGGIRVAVRVSIDGVEMRNARLLDLVDLGDDMVAVRWVDRDAECTFSRSGHDKRTEEAWLAEHTETVLVDARSVSVWPYVSVSYREG